MDLQALEWEQRRHLDEMRDLWRTLGPLLQQRHQFAGGMTWKTVKGYEYLARFQTDRITGSKKFEYLGRRKPETEAVYVRFLQDRESLDGRIQSLQRRMEVAARVAKALRLGRMAGGAELVLTDAEVEAVRDFIDPRKLRARHLAKNDGDGVSTRDGRTIADPGFITALEKIAKSHERP